MNTLTSGDVEYFYFYLKDQTPETGEITAHDLSNASTIIFRAIRYGSKTVELEATCSVVDATLGLCRVYFTVPLAVGNNNKFESEIEVISPSERKTWFKDLDFVVRPDLG